MLLTGAGLLAYVGWEYWGTDYVAKKEQAKIKEDLRDRWQHPTVADVLGPEAAAPAVGSAQALVRIPRFGTSYEVPLIEGVRDEDLSRGIGHFPGTGPGQIGNFALAGAPGDARRTVPRHARPAPRRRGDRRDLRRDVHL